MNEESKLKSDLAYAVDHIAKLTDFAIWMTGCCEMTQYDYFIKNRHLLSEPPIFVSEDSHNDVQAAAGGLTQTPIE